MLESFLIRPEVLTDDDVMDILKQAFSQNGMKEAVAEMCIRDSLQDQAQRREPH